jgi:hypothetical protein
VFVAACLAVAVVALLGCGGSDDSGGGEDARAQFDSAIGPEGIGRLESGNLDLSMKMDVRGDQSGTLTFDLTGPFQSGKNGGADFQLTADSSLPGSEGSFDLGVVATTRNSYITYGGSTYEIGAAQMKRLGGMQGSTPADGLGFKQACRMQLEASGADPSVCDRLRPSSWIGDISDEGTETIGGVETDHLQADLEVRKLVADLFEVGKSIAAEQGLPLGAFDPDRIADQVDRYVERAEVSAYPAPADGIPRKLGLDFSIDVGGSGSVDLIVDATFEQVNEPQTIAPPAGPIRPIRELADQLPQPFRGLVACLLTAKSQAELQACAAGVGALGGTGVTGGPSLQ